MIVALTAIGLGIADAISADIIRSSPHAFWSTVAAAWGQHGFGGFGSSALAALIALVEVFGALLVWLELIVRNAVIYIAVLFFPVALAASIWPPLAGWTGRLGRLLLLFVMLKPITLIVLSLAGNAAASGLSFSAGASASVGTILAAVVIFALAAFAPWALMYLLSADAESAWTGGALRGGAGGAVAGTQGRSVRNGGGLANLRSGTAGGGGGAAGGGPAGGPSGGGRGGGGSGGDTPQPPSGGSSAPQAGAGSGGAAAGSNGGSAAAAGVIGGGSVAAAAGMQRATSQAGGAIAAADGGSGAASGNASHQPGASSGVSQGGGAERRQPAARGIPERGGGQREGAGGEVLQFGARTGRPRTDTGSPSAQRSPAGAPPARPADPPARPQPVRGRPAVQHDPRPGRVRGGRDRDDVSLRTPPRWRVPARPAAAAAVRVHPRRPRGARRTAPRRHRRPRPRRRDPRDRHRDRGDSGARPDARAVGAPDRAVPARALQRRRAVSRAVAHSSATSSRSPTVASTRSPRHRRRRGPASSASSSSLR